MCYSYLKKYFFLFYFSLIKKIKDLYKLPEVSLKKYNKLIYHSNHNSSLFYFNES